MENADGSLELRERSKHVKKFPSLIRDASVLKGDPKIILVTLETGVEMAFDESFELKWSSKVA